MATIEKEVTEQFIFAPTLFMQPKTGGAEEKLDLTSNLVEMLISKDFDKDRFPIVRVILNVSQDYVQRIQSTFDSSYVYLSLKAFKQSRVNGSVKVENTYKYLFQDIRFVITGLDRNDLNSSAIDNDEAVANARTISYPLELFPVDALNMTSAVKSFTLHGTDTKNILVATASAHAQPNYKIALADPDLNRQYRSFNVPHKNFSGFLNFAQERYGLYNSTLISFFDIDKVFIMGAAKLAKFPAGSAQDEFNSPVCRVRFITKPDNRQFYLDGVYYDDVAKQAVIVSLNMPKLTFKESTKKITEGNRHKIMERNYEERNIHQCITHEYGGKEDLVTSEKIYVSRYDNPTLANQFKFKQNEDTSPVNAVFDFVHFGVLDPRKKFLFLDEYGVRPMSAEGYWRISKMNWVFKGLGSDESQNLLRGVADVTFKPYLGTDATAQ